VHNGVYQLVFPQGRGRVRLYLCYAYEERRRFSGRHATKNFLQAFRVPTLPHGEEIAGARVAGPCQGYPNADTWVDDPIAPGVVLIGDAAGHNDPTIGQGLSIAFRDVNTVVKALSGSPVWDGGTIVTAGVEQVMQDAQPHGLLDAPRGKPFAPYSVNALVSRVRPRRPRCEVARCDVGPRSRKGQSGARQAPQPSR
jgi:2-polyprenyl-6-methoxyphenol hydroxylase-like FAD-dependent oxidoreductase